jgi:hypothetical protein
MAKMLVDIQAQLEEPFNPIDVEFLPKGAFEKNGETFCSGFPYADVRVYEDRLNELAPGEWSTPPPMAIVAGNKLITYVTVIVCGVPHTDVGEAFLTGMVRGERKDEENTGTDSWAQAFKRACSQFGLGRFLYSLDKAYLPYDKIKKRVTLDRNGIRGEVRKLYNKAGLLQQSASSAQTTQSAQQATNTTPRTQPAPVAPAKPADPAPIVSIPTFKGLRNSAIKYLDEPTFEATLKDFIRDREFKPDHEFTPDDVMDLQAILKPMIKEAQKAS